MIFQRPSLCLKHSIFNYPIINIPYLISDIEKFFTEGGVSTSNHEDLFLSLNVLVQYTTKFSILAIPRNEYYNCL